MGACVLLAGVRSPGYLAGNGDAQDVDDRTGQEQPSVSRMICRSTMLCVVRAGMHSPGIMLGMEKELWPLRVSRAVPPVLEDLVF